ncbi:TetR/AcrR family transcriptional regulator [Microbacterium sp. P05]|uniref:TetR/AcrR family transcriptional regulator n=1 Tax=Microbacterium sp. P05 TaxID=3366948 RepID=UPI00374755B5
MAIADRRQRERTAQRDLITRSARAIAESEGWDAVTTRRLSAEIEYSQPVIYRHFASIDHLVEAVALEGFEELAAALGRARAAATPDDAVRSIADAYVQWAAVNPSLYDAMFTRATRVSFGAEDTPAPLAEGYAELRSAVAVQAGRGDVDTLTEVLWAGLHGLVTLQRGQRLRPDHQPDRVAALVGAITDATPVL